MLMFKPPLALKVMDGAKDVTRRIPNDNPQSAWFRERSSVKVGSVHAVVPGRGRHQVGKLEVTDVRMEPLHIALSGFEPQREGFADADAFLEGWRAINGAWTPMLRVWRVAFRVAERADCICWGHEQEDTNPACVWHGDHGIRVSTIQASS